jgi:hypothetical protein
VYPKYMASNRPAASVCASNGPFRGLRSWIRRSGVQVQVLRLLLLLLNQGDNLCHRSCGSLSPLTSRTSAPGVCPGTQVFSRLES